MDEADKCSDTNCRHPLASRTELLQSIRNPELHALAWFFEQHFRSLKAKVEKHGKVIGDIRSAQLRSETVEKEHLEYAKVRQEYVGNKKNSRQSAKTLIFF